MATSIFIGAPIKSRTGTKSDVVRCGNNCLNYNASNGARLLARCLRGSACHRTLECNRGHTSGGALAGDGISLHYQPRLSTSEIDSIERCFGKSRGADVVEVLERLGRQVGFPTTIRVDQGPEFVSRDLDLWAYQRGVTLDFSRPGKPTDNAFIEAFNSHSERNV